jgi:hypothetical protein
MESGRRHERIDANDGRHFASPLLYDSEPCERLVEAAGVTEGGAGILFSTQRDGRGLVREIGPSALPARWVRGLVLRRRRRRWAVRHLMQQRCANFCRQA